MTGKKHTIKRSKIAPRRSPSEDRGQHDSPAGTASSSEATPDAAAVQAGVETAEARARVDIEHGGLADGDSERPLSP